MDPEARGVPGRAGTSERGRPVFSALSTLLEELARTPDVSLGSAWDAVLRPGVRVGRFEMVREIGRGGFGVVWEARDTQLGRPIAFKALRVQRPTGVQEDRLLREVDVAARLAHPNIVTLHDCGRTEHGAYLVLELLRGETLAQRLERGRLPVAEALHVALETAKGVACAHAQGVVHRDLQPGNVFLCADGQVKILDFGLAHAFGTPRLDGGTPSYMAPEQRRGAPEDERTDVFALGLVTYRMLTGRAPFEGHGEAAGREGGRGPLLEVEGAPGLGELVSRMLERDPVQRPRDGQAVVARLTAIRRELEGAASPAVVRELRPPAGGRLLGALSRHRLPLLVALALAAGGAALGFAAPGLRQLLPPRARAPRLPAEQRLAVLPFRDVGPGRAEAALSAGLGEMLTNKLRQLEQFRASLGVVSPTEVVREGITSAREAKAAFGATLALSGTVHWQGDRVTVTASLVDAGTALVIAARDVEAPRDGVATLQRRLVAAVAEMLQLELEPEAMRRLLAEVSAAPGAHEFYLQGRGYLQRYDRLENLDSAEAVFQAALARDPFYALAQAGVAETALRRYELTQDARFLESARASARRALELGERLPQVQLTMGLVEVASGRNAEAIACFEKALELEPESADAHREMGYAFDAAGRTGEAEATFRRAIQLRPSSWAAYKDLGVFYNRHGRLTEALPLFQRVVELTPDNYAGYANLGGIYLRLGLQEEAVRTLARSLALRPTWHAYSNLGTAHFYQGHYADAADAYRRAIELSPADSLLWGHLADAERWAGQAGQAARDYRQAIELLEKQLALTPRSAELWSRIAMHRSALGERDRALAHAEKALRLAPRDGHVLFRAALVYEEAGLRDRALDAVGRALAEGFSREQIRRAPPLEPLRRDPRYVALAAAPADPSTTPRKE